MPDDTRPRLGENLYWRGPVIWARFKVRGREYRESLRTGSPKLAARRFQQLRETVENDVVYGIAGPVSWKRAVVEWRATAANNATTRRYATSLVQLRPWLDELAVQEVTHDTIRSIVSARRKLVTNATVKRDLTAISAVLDYAAGEDWVKDNAAHTFDRSRLTEQRDPIRLPEIEHIRAVIADCTAGFAAIVETALETGMRLEEVAGLEWSSVDLKRRAVTLYVTKRKRARAVPLSARAVAILRARPHRIGCPHVFWHDDGDRYTSVSPAFAKKVSGVAQERAQKALPFHPFTFHHLRHYFAVDFLRRRKGSIYDLQQILGHRSLTTTEIYLDYLTPDEIRAVTIEGGQFGAQVQRSGAPAEKLRRSK